MVYEIIVAFLGPLPLSRRPESRPFTPLSWITQSNGCARRLHPTGFAQVTDVWSTTNPARSYRPRAPVGLLLSTVRLARA
jgi:hypothetical protein